MIDIVATITISARNYTLTVVVLSKIIIQSLWTRDTIYPFFESDRFSREYLHSVLQKGTSRGR